MVLGYCSFIHDYCSKNDIDKILFLSRDGDILKKVYDQMYPGENTEYTYISRSVVTKLMRDHNRYDFFLRFADKMINQGLTIGEILAKMGVKDVYAPTNSDGNLSKGEVTGSLNLNTSELLTDRNVEKFKDILNKNFSCADNALAGLDEAAKLYYSSVLNGSKKAAVVDLVIR